MFWFKEKKEEQVKCARCKHWVDRDDCRSVFFVAEVFGRKTEEELFYFCELCQVPYMNVRARLDGEGASIKLYKYSVRGVVECDKNGKTLEFTEEKLNKRMGVK